MAKTYVIRASWDNRGYDIFERVNGKEIHEGSARVTAQGNRGPWHLIVTSATPPSIRHEEFPFKRHEGLIRAYEILISDYGKGSNRIIDETSFKNEKYKK